MRLGSFPFLLLALASVAWAASDPDLQTVPATVGPELVIGTAAFERPAIASNGNGLLLAWNAPDATGVNRLNVQRATSNGTLLGTRTAVGVTANAQRDPVLTADGTNFLLVWYDYTSAAAALRGSIINGSTAATSATFTISANVYVQPLGGVEGIRVDRAVAAWTGSVYRVFWIDGSVPGGQAMGAVVTPQGVLQSKFTIGDVSHLNAALSGSPRTVVIGTATVSGRLTLYSQAIEANDVPGPQTAIASEFQTVPTALADYLSPVIASSTSSTLAGWIVSRPGSADHIAATRVDPAGTPLDVQSNALGVRGFVIEPNPYSMRYDAVLNLLPDGSGFTLVWMRWGSGTFSGIWTLRLDANGRPISVRYPLALRSPLLFDDPQFPSATLLPDGSLAVVYIRNGARTQLYLRIAPRQAVGKKRGTRR
jgi:hypothetical protein